MTFVREELEGMLVEGPVTRSATRRAAKNTEDCKKAANYVPKIKWPDLTVQLFIHLGCLYGLYLALTQAKVYTSLWGEFIQRQKKNC